MVLMVSDNTQCPFQCVGSNDAVLVGRVCVCVFSRRKRTGGNLHCGNCDCTEIEKGKNISNSSQG